MSDGNWQDRHGDRWASAMSEGKQEARSESGWLIERGGLCLGFCEHKFAWLTFTDENALRFSRSRDAYSFMETVKWKPFDLKLEGAIVTEHIMGLSFMKCGKVSCEKARIIGQEFCAEHSQPQEKAQPESQLIHGLRERIKDLERFIEGMNLDAALRQPNMPITTSGDTVQAQPEPPQQIVRVQLVGDTFHAWIDSIEVPVFVQPPQGEAEPRECQGGYCRDEMLWRRTLAEARLDEAKEWDTTAQYHITRWVDLNWRKERLAELDAILKSYQGEAEKEGRT